MKDEGIMDELASFNHRFRSLRYIIIQGDFKVAQNGHGCSYREIAIH